MDKYQLRNKFVCKVADYVTYFVALTCVLIFFDVPLLYILVKFN